MSSIHKIALLGKGLLGSSVLQPLVDGGFAITVLSRNPSSLENLPAGVETTQVDYNDFGSLVETLKGFDAVIATLGTAAIPSQRGIIDACIEAGVKRYIPADWGSITTDSKARDFPINRMVIDIQDYLKEKAQAQKLEYTIFSVGVFLDYVLDFPFILDLSTRSIQLHDEGQHGFSATSVTGIGKAIVGALKSPSATKNRNVHIHEAILTQARVLALAKKHSPPGTQWNETKLNASEELKKAMEAVNGNPSDLNFIFPLLRDAILSGEYTAAYPEVDNELLGLSLLSDDQLESRFAEKFRNP